MGIDKFDLIAADLEDEIFREVINLNYPDGINATDKLCFSPTRTINIHWGGKGVYKIKLKYAMSYIDKYTGKGYLIWFNYFPEAKILFLKIDRK